MTSGGFAHLHCHSHYSLLDGAGSINRLIQRTKDHGMNSLAITDHGNLHGALEFYQKAKAAEINPIIGYEAYVAPISRFQKDSGPGKASAFHLTLLAQNRSGYQNLIKLASSAYLEGFYFRPRIDRDLLADHSEGLVCLSGCVASEFNQAILRGRDHHEALEKAAEIARWHEKVFPGRFYVEIMNNELEIQRRAAEGSIEVANRLGLPLVATSDVHYVDRDDAEVQDVLLCINTGKFRADKDRMKMEGNLFYLRSPEEMYAAFPGHAEAVARSQEIADSVDIEIDLGKRNFPTYSLPPDKTAEELLRELCIQGLKERYADAPHRWKADGELADVVMERLDRELDVINTLGFPNYFLIVWDFVRYAREIDVPATARGSGVGALVCYALYLSHVCPIQYDLLFERFLDLNRREAPDIDIDFCKERRGDIIRYVKDKYGEANVAQIGTFGTLAARAAIRDVGRALGIPLGRVAQVNEKVPEELGISLDDALEKSPDLKAIYDNDPDVREMYDLARKLEGLARNVGTHAAAVVIADKPLTEYVPLGRVTGKTDIITQWAMNEVEAAGLLKMDFLGLRNLTMLAKSVELIEQTTGTRIDPLKFPLDDERTFALLRRGETKGVFQLESGGIRELLQRMKPDRFLDIIATNALYRPGPLKGGMVDEYVDVKHGRRQAQYKHPVLEEVLEETNGVMVYQEQVMRILNKLGGIPLAEAYTCIKAISKKKKALIDKNYERFIQGSTSNGLPKNQAQEIWDLIIQFAGYGFNKSHSTAYALIAYQTAYLKAHYPVEFMAALLTGDIPGRNFKKKDSLVEHLEDCARMGVEVLPPDVNRSYGEFAVKDGKILFGLSAVKGCGTAADYISAEREAHGPFTDIFDFCERVDAHHCNRAAIETLIKAGAFDSMGAHRGQLLQVVDRALQAGASAAADRRSGQKSLFGEEEPTEEAVSETLPVVEELPERERLLMEKEVLGFYLTSHPLAEHRETLAQFTTATTADIPKVKNRGEVMLGGMISAIKLAHVRNPQPDKPSKYANFDLEDTEGLIRCILWPEDYAKQGEAVQEESIVIVRGSVDRRGGGDEANLIVNEIIPLEQLGERYTRGVEITLREEDGTESLRDLREILRAHPGGSQVQMLLDLLSGDRVRILVGDRRRVTVGPELRQRIDRLLGAGNMRLLMDRPQTSGSSNGNGRHGNGRHGH